MSATRNMRFLIVLFLSACSVEKRIYKAAVDDNTVDAYEEYLNTYEKGKYSHDVILQLENLKFNQSRDSSFYRLISVLKQDLVDSSNKIAIAPNNKILMGEAFQIRVKNLPVGETVVVHAYRKEYNNLLYAYAGFKVPGNGVISLNKAVPVKGAYSGAAPYGLFWSMTYIGDFAEQFEDRFQALNENVVYFSIEINGVIAASNELILQEKLPLVVLEQISSDSLTGMFFYPKNKKDLAAVILLNGSEGGCENITKMARIIASHGYAVFALAYFGAENLPRYLEKINVEYVFDAIKWVADKPSVDPDKIIIAGGSRGGELALLVASLRPDISGVIAVEPSDVLFQGNPHDPGSLLFTKPAWLMADKALPFIRHAKELPTLFQFGTGATQIELMPLYENAFAETPKLEKAKIKVEHINGPIMLIAGKDGQLWPSYAMCMRMEERLRRHNFKYPVNALYCDNAGHYVTITPELKPTIYYKYDQVKVGGTDSGNAFAQYDSWLKIIEFLKTNTQ